MKATFKSKRLKKTSVASLSLVMALSCVLAGGSILSTSANIADSLDPNRKYRADYDSMTETEDAAAKLNLQIEAEGAVLLKNKAKALPLAASAAKKARVTVLGSQADTLATGGSGSGGQTKPAGDNTPDAPLTLFDSLDAANIQYNPSVKARYEESSLSPKTLLYSGNAYDGGHYMNKVSAATSDSVEFDGSHYVPAADGSLHGVSLEGFEDTALVVFSRSGAEGQDNDSYNLTDKASGAAVTDDISDHYLQLTTSEKELMAYAKKNFDKVIVLLNSPSAMELGCLEHDEGVDAILWIGQPGWNGIMSVGKILNGEVNPSGRTVDFYMSDFATDPTWYNLGNYAQSNAILNGADTSAVNVKDSVSMGYDATYATEGITNGGYKVLDYAEGIYLGYRYYETVYADLQKEAGKEAADAWYAAAAVYPFGYGLSYTDFTQTIKSVKGDLEDKDGTVEVTVTVKNTGSVAGKEVIQLYSTPPYTAGEIEKAAVNLVGFEKTGMIAAGASEDVTLEIAVKDLASFDYNDANGNGSSGYELETGDYVLSVRKNSHEVLDSKTLKAAAELAWDEDGDAATPNNIYSQTENAWERNNTLAQNWVVDGQDNYLKRDQLILGSGADASVALEEEYSAGNPNELQTQLGWLIADKGRANVFTKEAFHSLNIQEEYGAVYQDYDNPLTTAVETDYENPWIKTNADIASWTQGTGRVNELGIYQIELADMIGVPLTDARWTTFMNQLTWEEMTQIVNDGGYGSAAITTIGKPAIEDHDGPGQLRCEWSTTPDGNGYAWACESVIGSTWNQELAYDQGRIVGNESIFLGVTGWYGPGLNTHRNPLSGRNFEYYSQDGVHGGLIAASVIEGATDMGTHVYMKHAFLNDQETSRSGVCTFATEQAIREIYAKQFELAVRKGNANGIMLSFNRIGIAASSSHAITIQMYEKEWGYDGISVTDAFYTGSGWTPENLVRGSTMPLNSRFLAFPPLQLPEGTWDQTLRGGKGGVLVKSDAEGTSTTESPTQYYWTRTTAMKALYTYANSNAMTGLKASMLLRNKTVVMDKLQDYKPGLAAYSNDELTNFLADMNSVYGAGNYDVSVSGVPAGMKLDIKTGIISGQTPAAPGVYPVTISVRGKGNLVGVTGSTTLNIAISAPVDGSEFAISYKGFVELQEGVNYVPGGDPTNGANAGKYTSVKYTASGLPEGLSIDEITGEITGTIANIKNVGEKYEITITQELVRCEDAFLGWFYKGSTSSITRTVYMTVSDFVTYHVNFDGFTTDKIHKVGAGNTIADLGTPAAPNKGYDFAGWAASADGKALPGTAAIPDELYALWEYNPIKIIDGTWWINGEDTGISAEGEKGEQGEQGETGVGIADITYVNGETETVVTITLTNGETKTIKIPNGVKGDKGEQGQVGPTGPAGADGKDAAKGGCKSNLAATGLGMAAMLTVLAGTVFVIDRRKKRN